MGAIPDLTKIKVNMQRIEQLLCDLDDENLKTGLPQSDTANFTK